MTSAENAPRGRRPWLVPLVLLFVLAVPIVEVWLIVSVGHWIGVWPTLALLLGEALLGAWLMRREGAKAWAELGKAVSSGSMPRGQLLDPVLIMLGGILVMLPGFFTDVIGLIFLLPFTRPIARRILQLFIARRVARAGVNIDVMRARLDPESVVPGETVPDQTGRSTDRNPQSRPRSDGPDPTVIKGEIEP